MRDIDKWGGKNRFDTKAPEDPRQLKAKINDIKAFLGAKTSTKSGITNVYKKRAASWNEHYKTSISWEDLAEYYSKEINKKIEKDMASEVANKSIAVIRSYMKQGKTIEDLQHLARMRKDGGFEFSYTKASGESGAYDMIVDQGVHKILRSKQKIEDLYMFLQR